MPGTGTQAEQKGCPLGMSMKGYEGTESRMEGLVGEGEQTVRLFAEALEQKKAYLKATQLFQVFHGLRVGVGVGGGRVGVGGEKRQSPEPDPKRPPSPCDPKLLPSRKPRPQRHPLPALPGTLASCQVSC
uniref:Uncharacterized protein n=1 Tax=Molossus molossus TaxID=27622 RepID=A0A7J8I8U5_MOLMO|nr:hypothetical protein HJG59_010581 [Molossus molossus]